MIDETPDGVQDPVYVDYVQNIPCDIVPVGGGERFRGLQLEATTTLVIETRFNPNYQPTMVAVNELTGEQYLINRILARHGRNRVQVLECVAVDG
jgi:hypothetical protein